MSINGSPLTYFFSNPSNIYKNEKKKKRYIETNTLQKHFKQYQHQ